MELYYMYVSVTAGCTVVFVFCCSSIHHWLHYSNDFCYANYVKKSFRIFQRCSGFTAFAI